MAVEIKFPSRLSFLVWVLDQHDAASRAHEHLQIDFFSLNCRSRPFLSFKAEIVPASYTAPRAEVWDGSSRAPQHRIQCRPLATAPTA